MDEKKLAYLAGFFDGEGSVYICRQTRSSGRVAYNMTISLTNLCKEPLEIAQKEWGGGINFVDRHTKGQLIHRLRIRSNEAKAALQDMLPYLIVKRERAQIAIEFQSKLSLGTKGSRALTIEECQEYQRALRGRNDKVANRNPI